MEMANPAGWPRGGWGGSLRTLKPALKSGQKAWEAAAPRNPAQYGRQPSVSCQTSDRSFLGEQSKAGLRIHVSQGARGSWQALKRSRLLDSRARCPLPPPWAAHTGNPSLSHSWRGVPRTSTRTSRHPRLGCFSPRCARLDLPMWSCSKTYWFYNVLIP